MSAKLQWLSLSNKRLQAAFGVALVCGAAAFGVWKWRERQAFLDPAVLLSRFPAEEAAVVSADFTSIRGAGLFGASKMALEPEYRQFFEGTGFDYRRDLQQLTAAFSKSGNYFIARGSFDWDKLRAYAVKQGGSCYQELCRMQGSSPERHISFLPLRRDVIALAVSSNDLAASRLTSAGQKVTASLPSAPVWVSFPGSVLKQPGMLPPLMRVMLSSLTNADRVVVTVAPVSGGMEVRLDGTCRTVDDARMLSSQLKVATDTLKKSGDDDLARALASGKFEQADRVVTGRWPVGKNALDALAAGI